MIKPCHWPQIGFISFGGQESQSLSWLSNSLSIGQPKSLTVWITTNWKILKEMGISEYLNYFLRNLYAGQEATVRTKRGTTDWFQIEKRAHQGSILSPCLFIICRVYHVKCQVRWSTSWNKDCRRNINNLRYADDTMLMAESEDVKSLLKNWKRVKKLA